MIPTSRALVSVLLAILFAIAPPLAFAAVPVIDAARKAKTTETGRNTLDTQTTKRGQSTSTAGVGCNFKRSKQQVMSERADVAKKIAQTCQRVGVEPALGLAIAYQESQFNQNCKAPETPWSGGERATGVMQVLPATGARVGRQYLGRPLDVGNEDDNILAGCLYLKEGQRITGGSEYHTITGYHNGYNSRVMRENLPLPSGWKNGLKYGELVQNQHLPYFRNVANGIGDPGRFQWDQLQGNVYSASANSINHVQGLQGVMAGRIGDQTQSVGQAPTTIAAWDQFARARALNGETQNNAIDALQVLLQLRWLGIVGQSTNESETAKLLATVPLASANTTAGATTTSGAGATFVRDANGQLFVRNADGSLTLWRPPPSTVTPDELAARLAAP
jgi:Transglycosylase SLT domain